MSVYVEKEKEYKKKKMRHHQQVWVNINQIV